MRKNEVINCLFVCLFSVVGLLLLGKGQGGKAKGLTGATPPVTEGDTHSNLPQLVYRIFPIHSQSALTSQAMVSHHRSDSKFKSDRTRTLSQTPTGFSVAVGVLRTAVGHTPRDAIFVAGTDTSVRTGTSPSSFAASYPGCNDVYTNVPNAPRGRCP